MSLSNTLLPETEFITEADQQAARNWTANVRALSITQSRLVAAILPINPHVKPLFARDGFLSAIDEQEQWVTGCSLPHGAAEAMFKKLDVHGATSCFLDPDHAAHLCVVLEKLQPEQALISVASDAHAIRIMLQCADFSRAIERQRLWFAWGKDWVMELKRLFEEHPGLPTPSQFIRSTTLHETKMESLVTPALKVFNEVNTARNEEIKTQISRRQSSQSTSRRVCAVAPSVFRLWDDAGAVLADVVGDAARFDLSVPTCASPLALVKAAVDCDAIISANMGRADVPSAMELPQKWIAWITSPRVPEFKKGFAGDAVILTDENWTDLAKRAGWPVDRIAAAAWPAITSTNSTPRKSIALIADTIIVEKPAPKSLELSSQRPLWDYIRDEIEYDPFVLVGDPDAYLRARMKQFHISEEGFERVRFLHQLILPAFHQSLAHKLMQANVPIELHGRGWDQIAQFAGHAHGPVESRKQLNDLLSSYAATIHPWPNAQTHPVDASPMPVLRCGKTNRQEFIATVRRAIAAPEAHKNRIGNELNEAIIRRFL
jgi:hypothetical protein